jgi:hypothetical protein
MKYPTWPIIIIFLLTATLCNGVYASDPCVSYRQLFFDLDLTQKVLKLLRQNSNPLNDCRKQKGFIGDYLVTIRDSAGKTIFISKKFINTRLYYDYQVGEKLKFGVATNPHPHFFLFVPWEMELKGILFFEITSIQNGQLLAKGKL